VAESERVVAFKRRRVRTDQLLTHQRREPRIEFRREALFGEGAHSEAMEDLPLDSAALEQLTLSQREALQPRRQQSLDRRRNRGRAALERERGHLLQEQRVSLAGAHNPRLVIWIEA